MRMRGGVMRQEILCVFMQPHRITNHICPLANTTSMTTDEPSEFFFLFLYPHPCPPPSASARDASASARNHVHNPHLVSFFIYFSLFIPLIHVHSPCTHAHNRVSHLHPVSFNLFLSFSLPSSASTAHAHATRPHAITSTICTW